MKKILTVLFLVSATAIMAQAKFHPGVKTGMNYSKITETGTEAMTRAYAGVFANIQFSDLYALQPEIVYSAQGGVSEIQGFDRARLEYIGIGLINKFFVTRNKGFHIMGGIGFDVNLAHSIPNLINSEGEGSNVDYTPIDFALYGGLGYEFDFGLILEARFKHGVIDVSLDNERYNPTTGEYRKFRELHQVFQFGLAYKFDFKKEDE